MVRLALFMPIEDKICLLDVSKPCLDLIKVNIDLHVVRLNNIYHNQTYLGLVYLV